VRGPAAKEGVLSQADQLPNSYWQKFNYVFCGGTNSPKRPRTVKLKNVQMSRLTD